MGGNLPHVKNSGMVGISGSVADDTVAVLLAAEVWTVPKPASWNTWAGVTLNSLWQPPMETSHMLRTPHV
jgi:hypothetical protein